MSYEMPKNRIEEERVYSVTMTEDELKLFSEFLEERLYFDYSKYKNPDEVRNYRNLIAEQVKNERARINNSLGLKKGGKLPTEIATKRNKKYLENLKHLEFNKYDDRLFKKVTNPTSLPIKKTNKISKLVSKLPRLLKR